MRLVGKMEIESKKNGSKIRLQTPSDTIDFGRGGLGFTSTDRTVSRHHISFNLHENRTTLRFQVKGKNPIWVRHCTDDELRVYKSTQRGELKPGDSFCVSSKTPVWFHLNRIVSEDEDGNDSDTTIGFDEALAEVSGIDYDEIETGDLSDIDPVKEFDFVVMGHEFDGYMKKLIRDIRNWNWFLEEPNKDSDDEDEEKSRKGSRKKRKKGGTKGDDDDDDDVWTGESEEDVEVMKKMRNDPKPKYTTRSKDKSKKGAGAGASRSGKDDVKMKATRDEDEEEDEDDEDEGDETLGGFIVDDEDAGEGDEGDDEEEEFDEDEDDE